MPFANAGLPSFILRPAVADVSAGAAYTRVPLTRPQPGGTAPGRYGMGQTSEVEVYNPNGAGNLRVALVPEDAVTAGAGGGTRYRTVAPGASYKWRLEAIKNQDMPTIWVGADAGGMVAEITVGVLN